MREYIARRLDEMRSLEDKAVLKEVLSDVFLPLYDEMERKYAELERRVYDEIPLISAPYTVYTTLLPREAVPGHAYLSPIWGDEGPEPVLDVAVLLQKLESKARPVLETVFYEADALQCQRLERDSPVLSGAFVAQGQRHPFRFRLHCQEERYFASVRTLYDLFLRNGLVWTTINAAYAKKLFAVELLDCPHPPPDGAKTLLSQVEYDFGAYASFMRRGLAPVWNVDRVRAKAEDFPMPALDGVNYEYRLNLRKLGEENGFLADYNSAALLHVRREKTTLIAVSPEPRNLSWDLYRVRRREESPIDRYPYPLLSNAQADSFSARLTESYGIHITTKAELRRRLNAFEASSHLELMDLRFIGGNASGETYEMNPFIRDEVRDPNYQKTLALTFRASNRDFFLNRDIMTFLVSAIQTVYPEYRCVGQLI